MRFPDSAASSPFERWFVLAAMVGVYSLSIADRYVISTVLEPIRIELSLTDSGVGFLTGVSLALFYVAFGLPIAWLMDRSNRRTLISVSVIAWSVMTLCTGFSRNYWQLLLSRFGVGIGESGATPGANSLISDYFPPIRRPMALTLFSLGAPIGAWLGAVVAGGIADRFGWRAVFIALGVPGTLFGLLVFYTVREPRRGGLDENSQGQAASFLETMRTLCRQRATVHLIAACALTTLWGWGLMWWTPAYLMRAYGLSVGEAGGVTGPVHLLGGVAATAFTGWIMTLPSMAEPRRIVWFLGGTTAVATAASIAIFWTHSLSLASALFWVFIPAIYLYIGPGFGILNNLAEPRMRALYCATSLFMANVANLVIAPQLVGALSDWFAYDHVANAQSLRLALLCLAPTGFWAAYHYWRCGLALQLP